MFDVDSITSISWNEKLLGNLVLQAEEKEMLLALIEENVDQEDGGFDDFFEGKGKTKYRHKFPRIVRRYNSIDAHAYKH